MPAQRRSRVSDAQAATHTAQAPAHGRRVAASARGAISRSSTSSMNSRVDRRGAGHARVGDQPTRARCFFGTHPQRPKPWVDCHVGRQPNQLSARYRIEAWLSRMSVSSGGFKVVLAAEIETVGADFGHLEPMLDAAQRELAGAGIEQLPEVRLGDAGYWHGEPMQRIADRGIQVLIAPDASRR